MLATLGWSVSSEAHFVLQQPAAATEQNALGNPQKAPPCGDDGSAVPTGEVTTYAPGDTVTIAIDETVYHPGHYRVALAINDPSELPEPPPVTPGATPCGSAPIDPNPEFPVLADGLFEHSEMFGKPQSIDITLPDDVTCTGCTLQVIQFMSDHALNDPGGCYYHHCATIAIEGDPAPGTTTDPGDGTAGSSDGGPADGTTGANGDDGGGQTTGSAEDGSTSGSPVTATGGGTGEAPADGEDDGGCSCSLPDDDRRSLPLTALLGLVVLGLRRRRR